MVDRRDNLIRQENGADSLPDPPFVTVTDVTDAH